MHKEDIKPRKCSILDRKALILFLKMHKGFVKKGYKSCQITKATAIIPTSPTTPNFAALEAAPLDLEAEVEAEALDADADADDEVIWEELEDVVWEGAVDEGRAAVVLVLTVVVVPGVEGPELVVVTVTEEVGPEEPELVAPPPLVDKTVWPTQAVLLPAKTGKGAV